MKPVEIEFLMVDKLSSRVASAEKKIEQLRGRAGQADKALRDLDGSGVRLEKTIGRVAAAFGVKELVGRITSVRGEMQQLEVAFTTMLGSAEKANALMGELVKTAATTPFGLEDVSQGAKQLLAYGLEAEKVNGTLVRLGDIAAGLSVPLNDLVYLYGTTMAQGRLYTQDLNQFTGRGIPMIGELAKQFGVAESKVKELVEAGKVGFPEVQKVIESLTDEGGRFGGLMEAQSKTITGQISNIEDSIQMMLNDIGQQNEGLINKTLGGVSYMVEHYEQLGRVLMGLAGTYGVYRTAIMTVTAARGFSTAAEALHYNWLVLVERAQKTLHATMLSNPYVLVATAIAGVVAVMISMKTEAERIKAADEAYEEQKRRVIEAEEEHRRKMEELCETAGNEAVSTDTRREALTRLEQKYPDIFAKYDTEYEKLKNIKKINEEIVELENRRSMSNPQNELATVNARIKELEGKTGRTTNLPSGMRRYGHLAGRSNEEEAELKSLYKRREALSSSVRKASVEAYFENLTGVGNETLSQQIRQRETLLARMSMDEKKYGTITYGAASLRGTYTKDELQYQLNKLRDERNRRAKPTGSSSQWSGRARKKYDDALEEYNAFLANARNSMTQEDFEKKAKELKDAVDAAKKEYDAAKPGKNADQERADKAAAQAERAAERRKQFEEKLGQELAALQHENAEGEVEAMEEGLAKKLRQIDNDYEARRQEIAKKEAEWQRDNKKAGRGEELSEEQQAAIDEANSQNEKKKRRAEAEAYAEERSAMNDYLREYGSYQQKKLAIAEEYAEKIRKATTEGERKRLSRERDAETSRLYAESLTKDIDWNALFSGVGNLAKEMAGPMMEQLRAYTATDEYRHADAQTQQQVSELIQELRKYVGTDQSVTWQTLATAMDNFTAAVARYEAAKKDEEQAVAARERGKAALAEGKIGDKEYKALESKAQELGDATAQAHDEMVGFGKDLNNASDEVANYTSGLSAALANAKTWKGVEGFGGVQDAVGNIDQLKGTLDTSLKDMGDGMAKTIGTSLSGTIGSGLSSLGNGIGGLLSSGMGQIVGIAAQIPRLILDLANGIKSFVTGILDSFTELLSLRWIDDLVVSILDAVGNLVNAIFDLPENLYKVLESIVVDGVGGLVNSVVGRVGNVLTLGALSSKGPSDWFTNSNAEEVASTIERLTERNETLEQAIEDLTDEMKTARGSTAIRSAEEAMRLQRQTNENYKQIAQAQASYHSAHHSWDYYWGGYNDEQKARLSGQIGRQWNGNIWDLSPEEMKQLRSNVDMWDLIKNTGEGPYGAEVQNKLNDYIDQAGKLEEITATLYENLTTTKENVFDDFLGSLYDLADGSTDVMDGIADNWQEMVNRMAVNNLVGAKFQKNLESWYERLAKVNEQRTQGLITDEEYRRQLNALKGEYEGYVQNARNDIETLRREGIIQETAEGSSRSQSGKAGAFTAMSQDQGTKLEGLFVSGQMHWASMDDRMEDVAGRMGTVCDKLARIEEHTGSSATTLGEIREDIKKMIRDGVKVR